MKTKQLVQGPNGEGCMQDARDGCASGPQQRAERQLDVQRLTRELATERKARAAAEGRALTATDEAAAAVG